MYLSLGSGLPEVVLVNGGTGSRVITTVMMCTIDSRLRRVSVGFVFVVEEVIIAAVVEELRAGRVSTGSAVDSQEVVITIELRD